MANHASAVKRNKQSKGRRLLNQMNRQKLRTQVTKLRAAISDGKNDETQMVMRKTFSLIDKSVQKGVIKANTARRYKSRMNRSVNREAA